MVSIALTLRDALLTGTSSIITTNTSLVYACKGPRDKPYTAYPWAEVILGDAPETGMLTGPRRFDRGCSIIIHAKTEESCMLALEQISTLYEGSSAAYIALKAVSVGAGNELLDFKCTNGQGSYQYDGANNEHIGIAEFILSYRKAVS